MSEDGKERPGFDKKSIVQRGKHLLNTIYEEDEKRPELKKGEVYLVEDKSLDKALSLAVEKILEDGSGYFLTRTETEKLKGEYSLPEDVISFHRLGEPSDKDDFDPSILVMIAHSITNFLEEKGGTAMIEGVEAMLEENSFDKFMTFLDNIVNVAKEEESVLILTLDPENIPDHQLDQIEDRLEIIS